MSDCIEHTGTRLNGYGWTRYQGREMGAHRAAYITTHGAVPAGLVVMHSCDNPPCVNPEHLSLGTQSENMQDCARKGRMAARPGPAGELNRHAKLTTADVQAIRQLRASGETNRAIAERYGVTTLTVWEIITRRKWKSVA